MIQGLIRFLLPRDNTFFANLDLISQNLLEGGKLFQQLEVTKGQAGFAEVAKRMKEVEHKGDELARTMHDALDGTFVTPIDREDLHALTNALEGALDCMDGTAERLAIYGIEELTPPMQKLVKLIAQGVNELGKAVVVLKDMNRSEGLNELVNTVTRYEVEADGVFRAGVGELFARKDLSPVVLVRDKDLLEILENSMDTIQHAMTTIRAVVMKNL